MQKIENQIIKVNARSITILNEDMKTKGVVTGCNNFKQLRVNKQMEYAKILRRANIWGNHAIDLEKQIIIKDNEIYFLHNLKRNQKEIAENAKQYIKVIDCYLINQSY